MEERLQKLLAQAGLCSRREAERWITDGRVTVNGRTASVGDKADLRRDKIMVDGRPLGGSEEKRYLMLYKPRGYVTTLKDERGRKTVADLVCGCGARVVPVGRLDYNSEGLLLLTNDGAFANGLMHPRGEVEKVYLVWVTGYEPGKEALLGRSITLDGYRIRPPKVTLQRAQGTKARLEITIHEGRNRQIRRMCQQAGLEVTRLKRIREGALSLGTLPPGAWRYLTEEEIRALQSE